MFNSIMLKPLLKITLFFVLFAAFVVFSPLEASAQSLDDLRASGGIGEAFDGYARARDSSLKSVVEGVNEKRYAIYQKRAQQQGISADQVAKIYAEQIKAKAPGGTWLLLSNGQWRQK